MQSANSARALCAPHRSPIGRDGIHTSRDETLVPVAARGTGGPLPAQRDPRPSEFPTAASHHLLSECPPGAPVVACSFRRTVGSTTCRDCWRDPPRTPQSTVRPLQPLLGWPSPS